MKHFFTFFLGLIFLLSQSNITLAEGFATPEIYTTNIKALIDEESKFLATQNGVALVGATAEAVEIEKTSSSLGISLAPIVGEGYDIATLIAGKDPITKEELGTIGTVITVAGLASGIGSGALARKAWKEFQADVLKKTGITEDEFISIAKEVIAEYKIGSFSEFISVWKRISFDNIKASVLKKAEVLKAGKVVKVKDFASLEKATEHFTKHGSEFGAKTLDEYLKIAQDFLNNPPLGTLSKTRSNGEIVMYYEKTGVFGVKTGDGIIKTVFKPSPNLHGYKTNLDYFNAQ